MEWARKNNGQGQTSKKTTWIQAGRISKPLETLESLDWSMEPEQTNSLIPVVDDEEKMQVKEEYFFII